MRAEYFELLKSWCDRLIELQITERKEPAFFGGILCPSCTVIHGRCSDAVYPFMSMARATGDKKYIDAAKAVFLWAKNNTMRADGSLVNANNNMWVGTTVFYVLQLGHALLHHKDLLDKETYELWHESYIKSLGFVYENELYGFDESGNSPTNINYPAAKMAAMAQAYKVTGEEKYKESARYYKEQLKKYISKEYLVFGEGRPTTALTLKGCRPVDIGYLAEEILPSFALYAHYANDEEIIPLLNKMLMAALNFMLPDGAWDNSFSSRNYKWAYWGGRTSDGCQVAYCLMSKHNPAFGEAAYRNFKLYEKCTHDGLLYGGPMYYEAGERPCVHHTFCHAKALAFVLDNNLFDFAKSPLPRDEEYGLRHIDILNTSLVSVGDWRATVSDYDYEYDTGTHAMGGALTLLWHKKTGPLLAGTMTEYRLLEPLNMQVPEAIKNICQTPRIEYQEGNIIYRSINDKTAKVKRDVGSAITITAKGALRDSGQKGNKSYFAFYEFSPEGVKITMRADAKGAKIHFPIVASSKAKINMVDDFTAQINDKALITLKCSHRIKPLPERIFNPVGGFLTVPFVIEDFQNSEVKLELAVD